MYCDRLKLRFGYRSVHIKPNYQVSNQTLSIPNLGGADRTLMFTSLNQTIRDIQTFEEPIICNKQPTQNSHLTRKDYDDSRISNGGSNNGNFLKADGSILMTSNLDAGNKQITNLGYNISNPSDVVNLAFCDIKYLQKTSNSELNMNENRNLSSPHTYYHITVD